MKRCKYEITCSFTKILLASTANADDGTPSFRSRRWTVHTFPRPQPPRRFAWSASGTLGTASVRTASEQPMQLNDGKGAHRLATAFLGNTIHADDHGSQQQNGAHTCSEDRY